MNNKYILDEIKKANNIIVEAYESLDNYESRGNNKYLHIASSYITEADEILSNLAISIEVRLEVNNDKLQ